MRLRMFIGALRRHQLAGLEVDVVVALRRAVDAIGPKHAGVEPLRRIGRRHLAAQHEAHFVVIGAGVRFAVEITALPAPIGPGSCESVEHLLGATLRFGAFGRRQLFQRLAVRHFPPQPGWYVLLLDGLQLCRHTGLAEIFLCQDIAGDLTPIGRHIDVRQIEDARPIRVANLADG